MTIRTKVLEGAAAVVLTAVSTVSIGAALGLGSGEPSPVPEDRPDSTVPVTPSTAGEAAIRRCDLLPEHYVTQEETVPSGGAGESVNAWAAGDVAVARYLNELARLCNPLGTPFTPAAGQAVTADAYHGVGLLLCPDGTQPVEVADSYHGVGTTACRTDRG